MKKKNRTYFLLLLSVICSSLFTACSDQIDDDTKVDPEEENSGTGYISLRISLDNEFETKAGGESSGIAAESYFDGLRLILYNSSGIAIAYYDYPVSCNGGGFNAGTSGIILENGSTSLIIPAIEIGFKPHRMVAILNYAVVSHANLQGNGYAGPSYSGIDYDEAIKTIPHDYNLFTRPVDLFEGFGNDALNAVQGTNYFFGGDRTKQLYPGPYTNEMLEGSRFLMTNANGPLLIHLSDIKSTIEEAGQTQNRIVIPVERAVAKIGLFKGSGIGTSSEKDIENNTVTIYNGFSNQGRITGLSWGTDIINLRSYLIRQPGLTAPDQGGSIEDENTDRSIRYAVDPNFEGISIENPDVAGPDQRDSHFFYIPADEADRYLVRDWITDSPPWTDLTVMDERNKTHYEYVTENTMVADEQYEDVTTRIVIKCRYIPDGFQIGQSYYYYHKHAFTHIQILQFLADPSLIPVGTFPELEGLAQVLADLEVRESFWPDEEEIGPITRSVDPNNPPEEPLTSRTMKELSYYKSGETYYAIPIRHFDDTESSGPMTYGRYGVVRNNVYRVVIDDIQGPGYTGIPEPKGADDKENEVIGNCRVSPWQIRNLHFDL